MLLWLKNLELFILIAPSPELNTFYKYFLCFYSAFSFYQYYLILIYIYTTWILVQASAWLRRFLTYSMIWFLHHFSSLVQNYKLMKHSSFLILIFAIFYSICESSSRIWSQLSENIYFLVMILWLLWEESIIPQSEQIHF